MKLNIGIFAAAIAVILAPTGLFGQAQITTRREKIKDFTSKTTKVVMSGDEILDEALREAVTTSWSLSPYEFCSKDEFNALKTNAGHYFLLVVKGQEKKEYEPGIDLLTLVKGGPEAAKGINEMLEVVSFPLRSAQLPSGRELAVLPAIIKVMQDLTKTMTSSEMKAYSSLNSYNKNLGKIKNRQLYIPAEDIAPQVDGKTLGKLDQDIFITDEDEVDGILARGAYNAVVSFVVAPADPVDGSVCYKMLFTADTQELLYFKKHRIGSRRGRGFLPDDLMEIKKAR
jgi:hypothetical protein